MMGRAESFNPMAAERDPDVEAVRLLGVVAGFARSAVIAAHPEVGADAHGDDDLPEVEALITLQVLNVIDLLACTAKLYIQQESLERLRRFDDHAF